MNNIRSIRLAITLVQALSLGPIVLPLLFGVAYAETPLPLRQDVGSAGDARDSNPEAADRMKAVDFGQVKVSGELGRRIDLTVDGNLLKIDLDKDFLAPFIGGTYTGFKDPAGGIFVGVGKTLDGMVLLAASTGDEKLLARKNHVTDALIKSLQSDGYTGAFPPDKRTWTLWDLHEQAFIITALVDDYRFFANKESLAAARKLADYIIKRWPTKPVTFPPIIREYMAEIGLNYSFFLLHQTTHDQRYLEFAAKELGTAEFDMKLKIPPPNDPKYVNHPYTYLSHCLAQLELYRLRPDEKLLAPTRRAVEFMTAKDAMAITGGVGNHNDTWTDDQDGQGGLGELCSTAYQIFVFDSLLRLQGDSLYGDLIERNLYNAAFAAQSPDGRKLKFHVPFEGVRPYFGLDSYCCPGNFRRLMGHLPKLIYYRAGNGLAVNLYTDSHVTLNGLAGTTVTIHQETDYPSTGRVTFHVEPQQAAAFPLLLRIPRWCSQASASVNGQPLAAEIKSGEFLKIERTWQHGDSVALELPMPWRFIAGRKLQAGRVAVMRGPVIYTLVDLVDRGVYGIGGMPGQSGVHGIDRKRLVLLQDTAELVKDDSVRPGGTACRIKADLDKAGEGSLTLLLQEFPHPGGVSSYFQLSNPQAAVKDELLSGTPATR